MKGNRLVKKVTFSIIFLFVIVLLLQLFVQNSLLADFYGTIKTMRVEAYFKGLIDKYPDQVAIDNYVATTGAIVTDVDFNKLTVNKSFFQQFSTITVTDPKEEKYEILVQSFVDERGTFMDPNFFMSPNQTLRVKGILLADGVIFPTSIESEGISFSNVMEEFSNLGDEKTIDGVFVFDSQRLVSRNDDYQSYLYDTLLVEIFNGYMERQMDTAIQDEDHRIYEFMHVESGVMYVVIERRLASGNSILTMFAIENVVETFTILNEFYLVFFMVQLLLVVVLAFILARIITRPMLTLIQQGNDIANLDFSKKSSIKTKDELGDLSRSLNAIADNLSYTIAELEQSRDDLAKENIIKHENEQRMRNMLSSISHDMKTPLSVIGGFVEILRDGVNDKEPDYYLEVMENEVDHMNALISETLEVTQLESGTYKLNYSDVKPNDIIHRVANRLSSAIDEKGMKVSIESDLSMIKCDALKMEQVIQNLFVNAIKYSPQGEVITIKSSIIDDKWQFEITNSGVMIPQDELEHIWDRFYRGDKSRTRKDGGHGLGMTIVKNILELHDADYALVNISDGVRVTFTL